LSDIREGDAPLIMAIVNATPDSFSDGGRFLKWQDAVEHCYRLRDSGADIIDIGAESTRPGATPVSEDDEWARLEKILNELERRKFLTPLSIDTRKAEVMKRVADVVPVKYVNNVGGLVDAATLKFLSRRQELNYICMHMHGTPEHMQLHTLGLELAVDAVRSFFLESKKALLAAGFAANQIFMDPGIGFGKGDAANWQLIAATADYSREYQLCMGVSRKSFLGRALNIDDAIARDPASKILEVNLMIAGAKIIRTHDVEGLIKLRQLVWN
jgi:dihydropteroate synthase